MASEVFSAREGNSTRVNAVNAEGRARQSPFANEKQMQTQFGLRNRPERFTSEASARSFARNAKKFNRIIHISDNPYGLKNGWYVMAPVDAEKMYRRGYR